MKKIICLIIILQFVLILNSCVIDKTESNQEKKESEPIQLTTQVYEWSMIDEVKNYKNEELKEYAKNISFVENMIFNLLQKYNNSTGETIDLIIDGQSVQYEKIEGKFDSYSELYKQMKKYCSKSALNTLLQKNRVISLNNDLYSYLGDTETWNYYFEKDVDIYSVDNDSVTVSVTRHMDRDDNTSTRTILYTFEENDRTLFLCKISELKFVGNQQKEVSISYGW